MQQSSNISKTHLVDGSNIDSGSLDLDSCDKENCLLPTSSKTSRTTYSKKFAEFKIEVEDPSSTPSKEQDSNQSPKKKKARSFTRRLWNEQEDNVILKLVKEYGTKKWTLIAKKLEEVYEIYGRSGKQCRERCVLR